MSGRSDRNSRSIIAWPGYVDALSALLMVVIFVLMIFVIIQFLLGQTLNSQKNELAALNKQVAKLTELLGLEKEKSLQLTQEISQISGVVAELSEDRENMLAVITDHSMQAEKDQAEIQRQMALIVSLNEDINALLKLRQELEQKVGNMAALITDREFQNSVLRDRSKALVAELADQTEMTLLSQKKIEEQSIRIQALTAVLDSQKEAIDNEKQLSANARAEVAHLSEQIKRLRDQLKMISDALNLSKKSLIEKDEKITHLGKQLNIALAKKINKLEKYRSEFFGRLKQILGNNPSIRIKGDRFVFEAGLLFKSGSAELGSEGSAHLATLANTLMEISKKIPEDINWILRIDGHTDRRPIRNEYFASNWELSAARAVSVVRFLGARGIPERRMAAAGFSKYHPIDDGDTTEAYQKNRRIEIKLTSQ